MTELAGRLFDFFISTAEYACVRRRSATKFYVPLYFTLRFLRDKDTQGQERIIKYWCLYSIFHILDWILEPVIYK